VELGGQVYVVDEAPTASQEPVILQPRDALTDEHCPPSNLLLRLEKGA
jgi:hypothetical protein